MSHQNQPAEYGQRQPSPEWRRWQVARWWKVYVTAFPVLVAVILAVTIVMLGPRAVAALTAPFALAVIMVALIVALWLFILVVLVIFVRRALRFRRMFLEIGPQGLVHHDGRTLRRIGWAEIDRLLEAQSLSQLGLSLRFTAVFPAIAFSAFAIC